MRTTDYLDDYKAIKFRFFALYAALFLLKDLVSDELFNYFLLFTTSCRLLSQKNFTGHLSTNRSNLKTFVDKAPKVYESRFVCLSIYSVAHVFDDVENTG